MRKTEEMIAAVEKTAVEFAKAAVALNVDAKTAQAMVRAAIGVRLLLQAARLAVGMEKPRDGFLRLASGEYQQALREAEAELNRRAPPF